MFILWLYVCVWETEAERESGRCVKLCKLLHEQWNQHICDSRFGENEGTHLISTTAAYHINKNNSNENERQQKPQHRE